MPVRPVTESEQEIANGQPVTSWLMILGASQGYLTHLRFNGISVGAKNIVATPFAKLTLPLFVIGGAAVGATAGFQLYGDSQLRRLVASHDMDKTYKTDAALYVPREKL